MPRVKGFLRIIRRGRPGRPVDPDWGIDEGEGPVDPDYGIPEGELPEVEPPDPPHGVWPPLTPELPWRPIPSLPERPSTGLPPTRPPAQPGQPLPPEPPTAGQLPVFPPGMIWPPLPPGVHGKFLALVLIGGMGHGFKYRYVVVDADAIPPRPTDPDYGVEGPPPREPKR